MFEKLELTRMAQALASYSGTRVETVARNIANADTPGYRAMDMPAFGSIVEDSAFALRATRANHLTSQSFRMPQAKPSGSDMAPNGHDVSLDAHMRQAMEARQSHEMALAIYRSTSAIIRTSLGRNS